MGVAVIHTLKKKKKGLTFNFFSIQEVNYF
ncbi:hypothetical protein TSACC_267 [Terrimicrobium sacchariphilum]|uniref:Uncharacterized protein n=1 Tax=Terrimicrobium sacchariphilum TaxID=690879 RepID=A0A146G2F6_TERSA|nr:hypothetical protein TSACC_267 [Terrimicrobium sacchariphilum]